MFQKIRDWLIAKTLVDGFKQIEKINWCTKALEICYKQKQLKDNWSKFIDGVIGLLEDAIDEAKRAKEWK